MGSVVASFREGVSNEVFAEMAELGVALHVGPKTVGEEAPFAYKDIDLVMAASAELVRPTKRLTPLGVVKSSSHEAALRLPWLDTRGLTRG